ncbi:hypothetical protein ACVW0P_003018 [Mucilaginibacter sp. UYNi724]
MENDLLKFVLAANVGTATWKKKEKMSVHMSISGRLWPAKGVGGILDDLHLHLSCHEQKVCFFPFTGINLKGIFEPNQVVLQSTDGKILQERRNPKESFNNHGPSSQWDMLDLLYFIGYAIWNYLTMPFNFDLSGFKAKEVESHTENDEQWRCLEVTFPDHIVTHSKVQFFYFDKYGHLRRHDYFADILGSVPVTHYVYDHQQFGGLILPTKRVAYLRDENNKVQPEHVIVCIEIIQIGFN